MARTVASGGSSTSTVLELSEIQQERPSNAHTKAPFEQNGRRLGSINTSEPLPDDDRNESLPSPTTAVTETVQRWNQSKTHIARTFAAFWSFAVMGANDAAYGALIPYLEKYYHLTFVVVSLIFLSPLVGYTLSAMLNNKIHLKLGQRGVAFIGPTCHLISFIVIAFHPPYPVLVVVFMFSGFGNGIEDAAWNAWMGTMANANELLGFLHGFYGLGAVLSPLIATSMITKAFLPWYNFYYVMIAAAAIELATSLSSFWSQTGAVFRRENPRTSDQKGDRMKEALTKLPAARVTWLVSVFLLIYVGVEVALGGWIVTFMLQVRHGNPFASGMTATGFWIGFTVGRIILGFVTPRIGEKLAIAIYLPIAMGLELLFWLVPQFYVSAVSVALVGFFLGPLFPGAIVVATKLLPKHLHVGAIGFAAAFGGGGAALFPFAVGAIAQKKGVSVLQPIVLALLTALLVIWLALPSINKKKS